MSVAGVALAGAAPPASELVTVTATSIGSARLGQPLGGLYARAATTTVRASDGAVLQEWPSAQALTGADGRARLLAYSGPLQTPQGDRLGSPLADFRRRHPWARVRPTCSGEDCARGWTAVVAARDRAAGGAAQPVAEIFLFDASRRLTGVELARPNAFYVDGVRGNDANAGLSPTTAW